MGLNDQSWSRVDEHDIHVGLFIPTPFVCGKFVQHITEVFCMETIWFRFINCNCKFCWLHLKCYLNQFYIVQMSIQGGNEYQTSMEIIVLLKSFECISIKNTKALQYSSDILYLPLNWIFSSGISNKCTRKFYIISLQIKVIVCL